jgi:hypothetical protein
LGGGLFGRRARLTGVGEGSLLGVEVALGLLGDDHGVLTLVFGSHCDVVVCWFWVKKKVVCGWLAVVKSCWVSSVCM